MANDEETVEKAKGTAKEAAGKLTGSDELAREGQAQQRKARRDEEADELEEKAAERRAEAAGEEARQRAHQGD